MSNLYSVQMREWETRVFKDVLLNDTGRLAAELMSTLNALEALEIREGLKIQTTSYVGRVQLGDVEVTITPKIEGVDFLKLLRYSYQLRDLKLLSQTLHGLKDFSFQDIFILQLIAEADEIILRGLNKQYVRNEELLTAPVGRINIQQIARQGGIVRSALPCSHYPRLEDNWTNQLLLAGLLLAVRLTQNVMLRTELRRLASLLQVSVTEVQLTTEVLEKSQRQGNRLVTAYLPAFKLIKILFYSQGYSWDKSSQVQHIKGFLFDMNRFFQALLSRFLKENLHGYTVKDEYSMCDMMTYLHGYNPKNRRSPSPRPDFVVFDENKMAAVLDAKYRDLWEHDLPRDMLYQLSIYALGRPDGNEAVILYPTTSSLAQEAIIQIKEPVSGKEQGQVILRPVDMNRLEELITNSSINAQRLRASYAKKLVMG